MSTPLTRDMFPQDITGTRAFNGLMRYDFNTVESIRNTTDKDLLDIPNFGSVQLACARRVAGQTDDATKHAYRIVIADLDARSDRAAANGDRRQYIQSVELARAILVREADLGEEIL